MSLEGFDVQEHSVAPGGSAAILRSVKCLILKLILGVSVYKNMTYRT